VLGYLQHCEIELRHILLAIIVMQAFRDLMLTVNNLRFLFEMRFYLLDDMLAQTSVF